MTESEEMKADNCTRLQIAHAILQDVVSDEEGTYGITNDEIRAIRISVHSKWHHIIQERIREQNTPVHASVE